MSNKAGIVPHGKSPSNDEAENRRSQRKIWDPYPKRYKEKIKVLYVKSFFVGMDDNNAIAGVIFLMLEITQQLPGTR